MKHSQLKILAIIGAAFMGIFISLTIVCIVFIFVINFNVQDSTSIQNGPTQEIAKPLVPADSNPVAPLNLTQDMQINWLDESIVSGYVQTEIWSSVAEALTDKPDWNRIQLFELITDGIDGTLAEVEPLDDELRTWAMRIDYNDFVENGSLVRRGELMQTVFHEYAHVLSLNQTQLDPEYDSCMTFEVPEGCLNDGSYLYSFIQQFWTADQLDELIELENSCTRESLSECEIDIALYDKYPDQFVSEYAASNPGEDFAEVYGYAKTNQSGTSQTTQSKIDFVKGI